METLIKFENDLSYAIKHDLDKLILAYEKEQSLLFDKFAHIWKDLTFSLIYGGQLFAAELKIFTELLFRIVAKYLITPRSLYAQTGALYALYGLYYKQPIRGWIKVRVTYDQVKKINQLIESLKENSAQEALFIYAKLCTDNAFDYVATELPRGLEVKFGRQQYVGTVLPYENDDVSVTGQLQTILGDDVQQLESVDEIYRTEFKKFKENSKIMLVMQDPDQSIGEKLRNIVEGIGKPKADEENAKKDSIQEKRRKLKNKAFTADVQSYRGKRNEISKLLDKVRVKYEEVSDEDSD